MSQRGAKPRVLFVVSFGLDTIDPMGTSAKPSAAAVIAVLSLAAVSMAAAVYFGGNGQLPLAMAGTGLFVILGGLGFELARRRSA